MQRYERALNSKDLIVRTLMIALRDAIFINSVDDLKSVQEMIKRKKENRGERVDEIALSELLINGRIRRFIPPKEILESRVQSVVDFFEVMLFLLNNRKITQILLTRKSSRTSTNHKWNI